MDVIVDIADLRVCADTQCELVTYSLGSCIGLTVWDPQIRVGGMIHYMLPESCIAVEKAKTNPAMFADTGVPMLFRSLYELGAVKKRLVVKVAGGASLLDDKGTFNIGQRNYVILRKLFWKNGILIDAENVGGTASRTLRLCIASGRVTVRSASREVEL